MESMGMSKRPGSWFRRAGAVWMVWLAAASPTAFAEDRVGSATLREPITAAQVQAHIEFLADPARGGRRGAGKLEARKYIISEFEKSGLQPLFEGGWLQEVPGPQRADGSHGTEGHNIGGFIAGTDPVLKSEWIIVNAHYDHLGTRRGQIYCGADDNASGVSMLLEVSRRIAANPPRRSVAFVGFDLEESMLWGSRWFVANPPMELESVKLCLTADMIGRSLGGLDLSLVFVLGAEHSSLVRTALAGTPFPAGLEMAQLGADMLIVPRSDYGPFKSQEVPFLFFSTGEHPEYHTPRDTVDRIRFPQVAAISEVIADLALAIANAEETPEWTAAEYQGLEEARTLNRVGRHLLAVADDDPERLSNVQRFFISQLISKTEYMISSGRVSSEERGWLVRSAQLLLLSVF